MQNFTEIYLAQVKILQKVLGEATFLTHTVYIDDLVLLHCTVDTAVTSI